MPLASVRKGIVKAISSQHATMQKMMTPAKHHSMMARPELPAKRLTLNGWIKMPLAIVRFIIKQKTVNGPRS